jgi:hypothetical protein
MRKIKFLKNQSNYNEINIKLLLSGSYFKFNFFKDFPKKSHSKFNLEFRF